MQNIKLTIEYDGTRYQGWQRPGKEENANTISGRLSDVLSRMTGEEIELFCGARTEANVHAAGQTASFKTGCTSAPEEIRHYLNHYLPQDIVILSAEEVPERFHASLNVKSQTWLYRITTGPVSDVFCRNYAYRLSEMPDIDRMEQAAGALIGRHDFRNFSSGKKKKAAEKELFSIQFSVLPKEAFYGAELRLLMTGSNFLHQMPRILAGTLLDIGCGKRSPDCIEQIFNGTEEASAPCPPYGLCLSEVSYGQPPEKKRPEKK